MSVLVSRDMLQRSFVDRRRRFSFGYPVRALPEGIQINTHVVYVVSEMANTTCVDLNP